MRIYKGDVGMELTVQSFLDLLEEDALDEAINMVLDLDAASSLSGDYDGDLIYMGSIDLDGFDGDLENLFDHITDNIEQYDTMDELDLLDLQEILNSGLILGNPFMDDDELLDNILLSNEDLRVKRIVQRFGHID
jgi:hypothetical protein